MRKFCSRKSLVNLANRKPCFNFYPPIISFYNQFCYTCNSFTNILPPSHLVQISPFTNVLPLQNFPQGWYYCTQQIFGGVILLWLERKMVICGEDFVIACLPINTTIDFRAALNNSQENIHGESTIVKTASFPSLKISLCGISVCLQ